MLYAVQVRDDQGRWEFLGIYRSGKEIDGIFGLTQKDGLGSSLHRAYIRYIPLGKDHPLLRSGNPLSVK